MFIEVQALDCHAVIRGQLLQIWMGIMGARDIVFLLWALSRDDELHIEIESMVMNGAKQKFQLSTTTLQAPISWMEHLTEIWWPVPFEAVASWGERVNIAGKTVFAQAHLEADFPVATFLGRSLHAFNLSED